MDLEKIKETIQSSLGENVILGEETTGLQPALIINSEKITEVCLELRDNQETYFDFLSCLTGVHHAPESNLYSVVYHLASIPFKNRLTLKVHIEHEPDRSELPVFKSVTSVWRTAEWHEREAYDLVGIYFDGNPDLRRILLPDDWEGFPLRKDYVTADEYKGIKIN